MCLTLLNGKQNKLRLTSRGAYGLMEDRAIKRLTGYQGREIGISVTAGIVMSG